MPATVEKNRGCLGILAGGGELPWIALRGALAMEEQVRVFGITDEEPPEEFRSLHERVIITRFFTSLLRTCRRYNVKRLLILGKVSRDLLYKNPKFDLRTIFTLFRMVNQSDYSIFQVFNNILVKHGIEIIPQTAYLGQMFLPEGRYGPKLKKRELSDVSFGLKHARSLNQLDIGQTVVVGDGAVLAIEAAEGTDRCIKRGGLLFRKRGAVVCKLAKIDHDLRFDIPTTGTQSLSAMHRVGNRVLAVEAKRTLVISPMHFLQQAKELNISVISVLPEKADLTYLKQINRQESLLLG